jgi:transcriptional regulator with XRE-family HTH domain
MAAPDDDTALKIARRVAAARLLRGWTPAELARRAGVSRRRVERCEEDGDVTCGDLARMAAALRLPFAHFLEGCCLCGE